jgi:hypothetical protein
MHLKELNFNMSLINLLNNGIKKKKQSGGGRGKRGDRGYMGPRHF